MGLFDLVVHLEEIEKDKRRKKDAKPLTPEQKERRKNKIIQNRLNRMYYVFCVYCKSPVEEVAKIFDLDPDELLKTLQIMELKIHQGKLKRVPF